MEAGPLVAVNLRGEAVVGRNEVLHTVRVAAQTSHVHRQHAPGTAPGREGGGERGEGGEGWRVKD